MESPRLVPVERGPWAVPLNDQSFVRGTDTVEATSEIKEIKEATSSVFCSNFSFGS